MTSIRHIRLRFCCSLLLVTVAGCGTLSTTPAGDGATTASAPTTADGQNTVGSSPYLTGRKPVPKRAQAQFDQAVAAMRLQQWPLAQTRLLQLNADFPQLSGPWLNLGIVYREVNRSEQARQAFSQAIAVNSSNLEAYNQLAVLHRGAGEFAAAETLYLQALAIWPQHAASHLNIGVLYDLYMGEFDKASGHYQAYQDLQAEPDRRVAGWLMDMQRRSMQVASKVGG